jgi:protein-disulfide isomerase
MDSSMKKKGFIFGGIIVVIIIIIATSASLSFTENETLNLDMGRTHGTVTTAMGSPIMGSENAPITIVEFGDYQCHQCFNWFHNTKDAIVENYIDTGKVNLIFVDLAFLGRDSPKAAAATYCAEEQGKYWEYHDLLYNTQEGIDSGWANTERLKAFAFSLGLDMELFDSCLDSGKFAKRVQFNINEAKKHGATGTPTFIIINSDGQQQKLVGAQPYSVFQNILESMI